MSLNFSKENNLKDLSRYFGYALWSEGCNTICSVWGSFALVKTWISCKIFMRLTIQMWKERVNRKLNNEMEMEMEGKIMTHMS